MRNMASIYAKQGVSYLENIESCSNFPKFKEALDNLKLSDLDMPYDKKYLYNPDEPLKYLKIIDEENLGMGIFFFPHGKGFHTHDHPGMMVATKILDGTLLSHSYEPLDVERQKHLHKIIAEGRENEPGCAKDLEAGLIVKDLGTKEMKTGQAGYLTPLHRNVHKVKAVGECAMLDVFIPNCSHRHFYTLVKDQEKKDHLRLIMKVKGTTFNSIQLKYEDYKNKSSEN